MVETTEAKQVCRAASTVLYPQLDFGVKQCGKYTREDFERILSRIAFDQEFANAGGKTLQLDRENRLTSRPLLEIRLLNSYCTTCETSRRTPSTTSSMASGIDCSKSFVHSGDSPRSSMSPLIFISGGSTAQLRLTTS